MTSRSLKIALGLSIALNLFVLGGAVAAWMGWKAVEARVEDVRRPPRGGQMMAALTEVDPETRAHVRQAMRASALAARPDFEEARTARREAVALVRVEPYNAPAVEAAMQRSREAESRGRARLEAASVAILGSLEPDDRRALAPILQRNRLLDRSGRNGRDRANKANAEVPRPPA